MALKIYVGMRSVTWTAKTKILFFCCLSVVYIIWIPISVWKLLYFRCIILNQINIHWYTFIQKVFGHFPKRWPRMNNLGKFYSFTNLLFLWRILLINLKGFVANWWKIKKKQGLVTNKYKASNMNPRNSHEYL